MLETAKKLSEYFTGRRVWLLVLLVLVLLGAGVTGVKYATRSFFDTHRQMQADLLALREEVATWRRQDRENQALWSQVLSTHKRSVANEIELRVVRQLVENSDRSITLSLPTLRVTVENSSQGAAPFPELERMDAEPARSAAPEPVFEAPPQEQLDALRHQGPEAFRQEALQTY